MELLDHGDVHGAIRLHEEMKLDSAMTLKIAVRQEAKEDMKLLLPSLVNNFQLLKSADDKVACDSVAPVSYTHLSLGGAIPFSSSIRLSSCIISPLLLRI